jgi:AbrB family looped-hinge helix DNA binding protein
MEITVVSHEGQVTIPRELREKLGISHGSKLGFSLVGDHIELRVLEQPAETSASGFGMLKSKRSAIPADFDPATLLDQGEKSR